MASNKTTYKNGTPVRKYISKLVAVPNMSLRPKLSPINPSSSTSPVAVPSSSAAHAAPGPNLSSKMRKNAKTSGGLRGTERSGARSIGQEDISKQVKWEYDVYATPFIPSALKAINHEQAHTTRTEPKHIIDYLGYVSTFVGTSFLPKRPLIALDVESKQVASPEEQLTESSYLCYFTTLLNSECAARKQENEGHALYKVPLSCIPTPDGDIWALSVPGLREDSPLVEMGDMIQLRQLWVDGAGNLMQMPVQIGTLDYPQVAYMYWTGFQHDASVYSVNRAQETVYLRAEGLGYLYAGSMILPMVTNVIFPLKQRVLGEQRRALVSVDSELRQTLCPLREPAKQNSSGVLNDFGESPGAKVILTAASEENACAPHGSWIRRILFPTEADGTLQTRLRSIPHRALFDHAINYEQAHAVNDICTDDYGTLPYLISGPPGTGKTKTLVEVAMQLLNTTDVAHILICAPSEAAADTLALRLKQYLDPTQLFRLNRPGRADIEVPRELTPYCYIWNDMFSLPPFKVLMAFNVVVTSCRDAAMLADAYLTNGDLWTIEKNMFSAFYPEKQALTPALHWGALFIDEAAQATEIDVLPALSIVCPLSAYPTHLHQPRFVMAGDENQFGPRIASRDPRFSTSLFARLFDRPLYRNHPLSRLNVKPSSGPPVLKKSMLPIIYPPFTNLIRNYRSHPAILSVPSSLFYNDTLIPEALAPDTPLQASSLWRGRKWPVLFLPHNGPDEIERDGGGWYNMSEARLACSMAQNLVYNSAVQQKDICIMSPFAAQVKLLRQLMRSDTYGGGSGLWDVNIGPLEAFQGLEKRVVILCTTRTRERFLDMDQKKGLGIIGQKRKMNVALTRAKEALFVIGSPVVLGRDQHWRQWLAFCWRNGLVSDEKGIWSGNEEDFSEAKIGVLERALVAKQDQNSKGSGRTLGSAADAHDLNADYELWVETLQEVLDEEDEREEDNQDEGSGVDGSVVD